MNGVDIEPICANCTLYRNGKKVVICFSGCTCYDWGNSTISEKNRPKEVQFNTTLLDGISNGGSYHLGMAQVLASGTTEIGYYVPNTQTTGSLKTNRGYKIYGELTYIIQ